MIVYDRFTTIEAIERGRLSLKAQDVMTASVVAARQSTTAMEISAKLLIGDFNGLPVIDVDAKVIGIVTTVDILRALKQGKNLEGLRAADIMTRNPVVVNQNTEINEIIDIILQKAIILVPVVDERHKLVGVVGRLDILQNNLNEKFITIGSKSSSTRSTGEDV